MLEQKQGIGKKFSEVLGIAEEARTVASEAKEYSSKPAEKLTHEEVFNLLTKNGALQGLYRGDDGELYINASYIVTGEFLADLIKTGIIRSKDGSVAIDLANNCVTIDGTRNGYKTQIVLSSSGLQGYGESTTGVMESVLSIDMGVGGLPTGFWNEAWQESTGLSIGAVAGASEFGATETPTKIYGSTVEIVSPTENLKIFGKSVYWRDNGDGTKSLVTND
jgi:hypothetical protein